MLMRQVFTVAIVSLGLLAIFSPENEAKSPGWRAARGVDSDGDGIADDSDVCCDTAPGSVVDGFGRPLGDFDNDCDVDLDDYGVFAINFTGAVDSIDACQGVCGDGTRQPSEACDDGAANGTSEGFCNIDCTRYQMCYDDFCDGPGETCESCPADCGTCQDLPPDVVITEPANDTGLSDGAFAYDGYDKALGLWYKDVKLHATAVDNEDGVLPEGSLIWTTDRADIQPGGDTHLGAGTAITTRLYSNNCFGVTHVINLNAMDSHGNEVNVERRIFIWTLCE